MEARLYKQDKTMTPKMHDIIAIDVSKARLDLRSESGSRSEPNSARGFAAVAKIARAYPNPLVLCEASGGYERPLIEAMARKSIPTSLVNPRRLRSYALSLGTMAKTDAIDAKMLWLYGRERGAKADPPVSSCCREIADLMDRRDQLSGSLSSEKARLDKAPALVADSIRKFVGLLEREIARIEAMIERRVSEDPSCRIRFEALLSVSGVGKVTAWSVIARVPEIAEISRARLSSLAGLAPFNRDSGQKSGRRSIHAGRAKLRKALYMAALSSITYNDHLKSFYRRLRERGKPAKVALVAVMRKLLIHLRTVVIKAENVLA